MARFVRKYPRFSTSAEVKVKVEGRDEFRDLWMTDISKGGLFVKTDEAPPMRSKVAVRISGPDGELTLTAEVVHIVDEKLAESVGMSPGVGLQVTDLPPEKAKLLEDYVDGVAEKLREEERRASLAPAAFTTAALGAVRGFFDAIDKDDIYGALGLDPRASTQEARDRAKVLRDQFNPPEGASPAQAARFERASAQLVRAIRLLTDDARRLEYDIRHGFIFAEERAESATRGELDEMRAVYFRVYPDRLAVAEQHAADALEQFNRLEFESAMGDAEKAIENDPFNTELRRELGLWREKVERIRKANADADAKGQAEPLVSPERKEALIQAARVRFQMALTFLKKHDYEKARKLLEFCWESHPERGIYAATLGWTYLADPKVSREVAVRTAEPLIQKGRELDPKRAEVWYYRGQLMKVKDDPDAAIESFERATRLNPRLAGAATELRLLQARRDKDG